MTGKAAATAAAAAAASTAAAAAAAAATTAAAAAHNFLALSAKISFPPSSYFLSPFLDARHSFSFPPASALCCNDPYVPCRFPARKFFHACSGGKSRTPAYMWK